MQSTLTIRIPLKMKRKLIAMSKAYHIPLSDLVRSYLDKMIAIRQFRQLRNQILPFAEAQGFLTDEDIFDQIS